MAFPNMTTTPLALLQIKNSETSYWIVREIMEKTWGLATIFDFSFVIVSIADMTKPNSFFRSPYFILIFISTFIRTLSYIVRFCKFNFSPCPHWSLVTYEMWNGFSLQWHGIIILALAANRATALGLPLKHSQLWRPRNFSILLIAILFWPLVPNLFISHIFYCYWWLDRDEGYCRANFIGTHKYIQFSNLLTPFIALFLNIFTIWWRRRKPIFIGQCYKQKIEEQLFLQSFYFTVTFTSWVLLTIIAYQLTPIIRAELNEETKDFLLLIRNWIGQVMTLISLFYFEGGLILLLYMSNASRQAYCSFYRITYFLKRIDNFTARRTSSVGPLI